MFRSATLILVTVLSTNLSAQEEPRAVQEIRRELARLPQYGVFDLITFDYERGLVTLGGYVTEPSLKRAAEKAVKRIEGVEQVTNRIESLPSSRSEQDLRENVRRAIYVDSALSRYENAVEGRSAIHIVVDQGNVILAGVVDRLEDVQLAELKAKGVFGVRTVVNNLQTATQLRSPDDR